MKTTDKIVLNYLKEKCSDKPWQYHDFTIRDIYAIEGLTPHEILTGIDRLEAAGKIDCDTIGSEDRRCMIVKVLPKKRLRDYQPRTVSKSYFEREIASLTLLIPFLLFLFIRSLIH